VDRQSLLIEFRHPSSYPVSCIKQSHQQQGCHQQ